MQFIQCTYEAHASAILDIFNDAIMNTTALYEYQPRDLDSMIKWFQVKQENNFPVIGALDEHGNLLGFASYGQFRPYPANKYTVEHSVYINLPYRGRGLGRILLEQLITLASEQQYHTMIGAIDLENQSSIRLHESLGFSHSGTIRHAAFKFGNWLDLGFYQLLLDTPLNPVDA